MTGPLLPPAAARRPAADGSAGQSRPVGGGQRQPTSAVVLALTRHGPLIESARPALAGERRPAPAAGGDADAWPSPPPARGRSPARLLAIGGRAAGAAGDPPAAAGGDPRRAPRRPAAARRDAAHAPARGPPDRAGRPRRSAPPLTVGLALATDAGRRPTRALPAEVVRPRRAGAPAARRPATVLRLEAALDLPPGARLLLTLPPGPAPADAGGAADDDPLRRAIGAAAAAAERRRRRRRRPATPARVRSCARGAPAALGPGADAPTRRAGRRAARRCAARSASSRVTRASRRPAAGGSW